MYFKKSYISSSVLITIFLLPVVNFNVEFAHFYTQQYETVENRDFWACNFIQEEYYTTSSPDISFFVVFLGFLGILTFLKRKV